MYARLGRGLVFDDEIAAQQRMRPEAHPTQFRKQRRVRGSRQFRGSGDLSKAGEEKRTERRRAETASNFGEAEEQGRVEEKDRADARAGYGSKRSRPEGEKGARRAGGPWMIKRREVPVSSLIRLLILHLHLHLHLHNLYLAALFPTHPLHYTVALDSESEARYVRRQGRGLGI